MKGNRKRRGMLAVLLAALCGLLSILFCLVMHGTPRRCQAWSSAFTPPPPRRTTPLRGMWCCISAIWIIPCWRGKAAR